MRGLSELVFSVTNQCTARCKDCPIVSDDNPVTILKLNDMIRIFDQVFSWGSLNLVVFTGGEPFLLGNDLRCMISYVSKKEILTRIVTNAYWATTKKRAVRVLNELKSLGLTELNISCDDYHQEYIPIGNIKNANEAAIEVNLPLMIAHRRKPGGKITVEYLSEFLGVQLHEYKIGEENPKNNVICSGRNIPMNSFDKHKNSEHYEVSKNEEDWSGACKSVLRSIIVMSDLKIQICCGIALNNIPELCIGSLEKDDLYSILVYGNKDFIANWIALEGPSSILKFVLSKNSRIKIPKHYVNRCHLCNELFTRKNVRSVLAKHAIEHLDAVLLMRGVLDWITGDWAETLM